MTEERHLQILITAGPEAQARATLGFAAAATAAASGTDVSVFLVLNGIWWAQPSKQRDVPVAGFPTISELLDAYLAAGGVLEGCTACFDNACQIIQPQGDLPVEPMGLTTIALRMTQSATVVF
jgi:predicted peroxiredoxin